MIGSSAALSSLSPEDTQTVERGLVLLNQALEDEEGLSIARGERPPLDAAAPNQGLLPPLPPVRPASHRRVFPEKTGVFLDRRMSDTGACCSYFPWENFWARLTCKFFF